MIRKRRYSVYIIELHPEVLGVRKFMNENPGYIEGMQCLYVGQTATTPEQRFEQHKKGYKANKYARCFGLRLRPELYERYNPIATREKAEEMEAWLAHRLRNRGYAVWYN
ncbi:MAG: GIY-YIG nuclease family protein [bacterium]